MIASGLLLLAAASAADRAGLRLWSWSGMERVPAAQAANELRMEQQLGFALRMPSGLSAEVLGAIRDPAAGAWTGDLHRLALGLRGPRHSASLGRFVLAGERGLLRLDGARLDLGLAPATTLRAWGGRAWHPETFAPGDLGLVGAELRAEPHGVASGGAGWEIRLGETTLDHRAHAFGRLRGPRGALASVLAEAAPFGSSDGPLDLPVRCDLRASGPVGRSLGLGAGLRWEDLARASEPEAVVSPMDWLAGPGYLAADLEALLRAGRADLTARGGPTRRLAADGALGGLGRAGASVALGEGLSAGLAATGAVASPSWVWGGVGEIRWQPDGGALFAEAGAFRFLPLGGDAVGVFEGRVGGELALARGPDGGATLGGGVSAGTDRALLPWVRGGLSLQATWGGGGSP